MHAYNPSYVTSSHCSGLGILVLTTFALKFKDYDRINNTLLQEIKKQNLELKRSMETFQVGESWTGIGETNLNSTPAYLMFLPWDLVTLGSTEAWASTTFPSFLARAQRAYIPPPQPSLGVRNQKRLEKGLLGIPVKRVRILLRRALHVYLKFEPKRKPFSSIRIQSRVLWQTDSINTKKYLSSHFVSHDFVQCCGSGSGVVDF